jgi:hypothetical protein
MADNLKGFDEETLRRASNIGDAIKEIKQQTRDLNKELNGASAPLSDIESYYNNISGLSRKLLDIQDKSLYSSKGTGEALKKQNEARNQARALDIKINELLNQKVEGNTKLNSLIDRQVHNISEAKDQAKMLAEEYGKIAISSANLDTKTKFFSKAAELVKDVRGLRTFAGPFEAAAKAAREQVIQNEKALFLEKKIEEHKKATKEGDKAKQVKIGKEIKEFKDKEGKSSKEILAGKGGAGAAGGKAFTESIGSSLSGFLKGPIWITALIEAAKFIMEAMFEADNRVTKLAKGMSLTKDEARGVYNSLKETKLSINSIYNTTKDVTEAFTDLVDLTGFVTSATDEMIEAQIVLTKNIGLSKEEAFGVQEAFVAFNTDAKAGYDIVNDQLAVFANQNKLLSTGKAVFNDIAKTSKLIQINFNGNLGALVKTTLEAKKLGLSLDQVSKVGSSLLNFEESISSELEAELLTGRDINLEKARAYALNHDIAGLAQEITNQGITQDSFSKMNVIQQEAIAKSLGMSAEEMGDMLYKQKVLEKVGGQTLKNLRERAKVLEKEGKTQDSINLQNKVAALEQGILSGKSFEESEKATSAQEKFNQALEQAKEIFTDFIDGGFLDQLADAIKEFADLVLGAEGRAEAAKKTAANIKSSEDYKKFTEEQKKTVNTAEEIATKNQKGFGDYFLSSFLGPLGIAFTDALNASAKAASQNLTQMKSKGFEGTTTNIKKDEMPAKDFVIRTLPEDTVVGMGGTALGRTDEMVKLLIQQNQHLDKQNALLASIYNKEGTIVLDGTKMGTAMNVGGYKTA